MSYKEERDEAAREYAEFCDNESGSFLQHQLENIRSKAFKAGHDHCLKSGVVKTLVEALEQFVNQPFALEARLALAAYEQAVKETE